MDATESTKRKRGRPKKPEVEVFDVVQEVADTENEAPTRKVGRPKKVYLPSLLLDDPPTETEADPILNPSVVVGTKSRSLCNTVGLGTYCRRHSS